MVRLWLHYEKAMKYIPPSFIAPVPPLPKKAMESTFIYIYIIQISLHYLKSRYEKPEPVYPWGNERRRELPPLVSLRWFILRTAAFADGTDFEQGAKKILMPAPYWKQIFFLANLLECLKDFNFRGPGPSSSNLSLFIFMCIFNKQLYQSKFNVHNS